MEVILLEKMRNLGELGKIVNVKPGYARNYLVPNGKAVFATAQNKEKFEKRRSELEAQAQERTTAALARQEVLQALPVFTISAKTAEGGKLFGSIGIRDVMALLEQQKVDVQKREIHLPQGAIRALGEYDITIDLGSDVVATIKLNVIAQA